jgi:hypothetical protein
MFKKVLMTIGLLLMANLVLAQGTIKGTIIDSKTKEPVPFANVVAKQDGKQIKGTQTDMDGNFTLKPLNVGQYEIQASCVGYNTYTRVDFTVKASGFSVCNIELSTASKTLEVVEITESKNPIIDIGSAESGERVSADAIAQMPGTSVENIVAAVGGVGYNDGGTSTARGEDGMVTNVGGVRKRTGVNVPKEAIAEIQVILGGTPASIGEAIGGTQIITLKPPSSQFKGVLSLESILDYRYWNRLTAYLTGPVIKQDLKDENGNVTGDRTLVGFRLTSRNTYQHQPYYRPRDRRYKIVNDNLVRQYEQSPISYDPVTQTTNYSAETGLYRDDFVEMTSLSKSDFGGDQSRVPHSASYVTQNQLSFDIRFSDYATLAITGDLNYSYSPSSSLMPLNMARSANGVSRDLDWGVTVDFTQRFPDDEPTNVDNTDGSSSEGKAIKNVFYNIVAMFERDRYRSYNENFGGSLDDVFNYGFYGSVQTNQQPSYEAVPNFSYNGISRAAMVQNSWYDIIDWSTYKPYAPNQILANYNLQLLSIPDIAGNLYNIDNLRYYKGLANGDRPDNIYGLLDNVGIQSTTFGFGQDDYIYVAAKASAEIKGHALEIGFQYDRMDRSSYGLSAYQLWTIMRQMANRHILQMDLSKPHYRWEGSTLYVDFDRLLNKEGQSYFDRAMRESLGMTDEIGEVTYLDVDRYEPEKYVKAGGLDMFSSDELFNNGSPIVSYYGYDHTGKKYNSSNWSLKDFFSPSDPKYRYIPSYTPTYMAGYIQDQFYFSDLIFNVGVRVDIFDANQSVLKDPYLLYESWTVKDLKDGKAPYQGDLYSGAGDDWTVYVDAADADNPTIYGYRNGSIWYDANGVELSSPMSIAGKSGKPTPYRTPNGQKALTNNTVGVEAFEDYKPQVVVQPRIAFSFPVGENAQFKASYDIIARRPSGNWRAEYLNYLYMSQITSINNPNLKPEKITNYELGFQQALNKSNAISISAFYKETRDLIQIVQYSGADPNNNYYSYDNIDFKTTKGLTLSYDLRQSKNIRVNANYTLQYAEGTGLTSATMQELIKEGYTTLKMLNPIADDRRHEFKVNFDFRYQGGKKYNGPTITRKVKDKETGEDRQEVVKILENFGIDFIAVAQSGRPYTKAFSNTQSTIVGSYNGARLPWGFYFDLIIDKRFPIKVGKRESWLTVSLSINNLFDIRNTTSVWPVTGNPEDNGYLTDPETQSTIERFLDPASYRDIYSIVYSNSYWRYSTPRRFLATVAYSF